MLNLQRIYHVLLWCLQDEDLDYEGEDEKDISQMKISVLVGGSKEKKWVKFAVKREIVLRLECMSHKR